MVSRGLIKPWQKTDIPEPVPILPLVAIILEKYKHHRDRSPDKKLLPVRPIKKSMNTRKSWETFVV